jgi:uncharacterized protein (DUF1697 family)
MPELAASFSDAGYRDVQTYAQSGNVVFTTDNPTGPKLEEAIERTLEARFGIQILVVVRTREEFAATIAAAPPDHGSKQLRSEVFFLKHPSAAAAIYGDLPELREGVDSVALGPGAIYFSRVAAHATKTRITRLMSMPVFREMTVRSWSTSTRLLAMLGEG